MPLILLMVVLAITLVLTQGAVYLPSEILFSLHLPFWFTAVVGLLLFAWLLED